MTWIPPWSSRALGYFTSPKTVEYRLTRREMAVLFNREEHEVPGGFCIDVKSMVAHLRSNLGAPTADQSAGWGVIEADPAPQRISPEERARLGREVAASFLGRIEKDRERWIRNGGTSDGFEKLKMCTQLDDPNLTRTVRVDVRAHERLHAKSPKVLEQDIREARASTRPYDLRLLEFLQNLFERHGENRLLPQVMRKISMQKNWSVHGNNMEEVLARVEGYAAAERDLARPARRARGADLEAGLRILHSEYGGADFEEFRQALARSGYTPSRVLREALR